MDYYYLAELRDSRCDIEGAWEWAGGGSASTSVAKGSCKSRDPAESELKFGDGKHYFVNLQGNLKRISVQIWL